jgi:alanine dehydrogenase
MDVGLVKDRRPFEHRIGLTPGGVRALTEKGHRVYLEDDAGLEAGFSNEVYRRSDCVQKC